MNTPAGRLNEVLRYTETNVKSLSERLGYNRPQGLYDIVAGRTKSLSDELCRRIVTAFPVFDFVWLKTGEGEMLKAAPQQETAKNETEKITAELNAVIRSQQITIERLTEMLYGRQKETTTPKKEAVG